MSTVRNILKGKGNDVFSIPPSATVLDALQVMAEKGCGAILITENDHILGIFSERDYARRVVLQGKTERAKITDVMTKDIFYVSPQQTADECMAQMTDKHIRHLPVGRRWKAGWCHIHWRPGKNRHQPAEGFDQQPGELHHRQRLQSVTSSPI